MVTLSSNQKLKLRQPINPQIYPIDFNSVPFLSLFNPFLAKAAFGRPFGSHLRLGTKTERPTQSRHWIAKQNCEAILPVNKPSIAGLMTVARDPPTPFRLRRDKLH